MRKEPLILDRLDQLLAVLQKKVPRRVLKVDQRMVDNFNRNKPQDCRIIYFLFIDVKKIKKVLTFKKGACCENSATTHFTFYNSQTHDCCSNGDVVTAGNC